MTKAMIHYKDAAYPDVTCGSVAPGDTFTQDVATVTCKYCGDYVRFITTPPWSSVKNAPGCSALTHVVGTNGGTLLCGAYLVQGNERHRYYCDECNAGFENER